MSRSPFQVLVFLCRRREGQDEVLLLKRSDLGVWQGVAGGGEGDETPMETAIRETLEETGVLASDIVDLDSAEMLSVLDVAGYYRWGESVDFIPEYAFCADVPVDTSIKISSEHTEYRWCSPEEALDMLEWESNKRAIVLVEKRKRERRRKDSS